MSVTAAPSARISRMSGWLGAVTSTDHKRIGLTLGVCSLFFFLLGGVFALLMPTQLAQSNMHFVSDNSYDELLTMHGSTMIYLFVTPMAIAMAVYLVPLQIGATRLSGPGCAWPGCGSGCAGDSSCSRVGLLQGVAAGMAGPRSRRSRTERTRRGWGRTCG